MKTEEEIRQLLAILKAFNREGCHDKEIMALQWVLGEYPPKPVEIVHGVNCPKVHHVMKGMGHLETEDGPVVQDGIRYCGRCHVVLGPV